MKTSLFDGARWWHGFAGWLELIVFIVAFVPALLWFAGVKLHRFFTDSA